MPATSRIPKVRAYKDILTPALHKRFAAGTIRILLPVCYIVSLAIGEWNSLFWSWFPLGRAGIRTGLLFICVLAICILRVSQWHIGIRTTKSSFHTFVAHWFRFETIQTALHYLFSAWVFCEVYIYSATKDANIYWLSQGKIYERQRLNERAIYLMSFYLLCALLQTGDHILYDHDRIDISTSQKPVENSPALDKTHLVKIQEKIPVTLKNCFTKALLMTLAGPFIYSIFIRQNAWRYTLTFAKIFWSLPKTSTLPVTWPFHIMILLRSLLGGFLLFTMWDISNLAFSVYVGQPPLKNGKPITDGSNDPNGSLINGLKSRKMNKDFAFWELQRITQDDQARRRTIYEEIERKGDSTWLQIFAICTEAINGVNVRIAEFLQPPTPAKTNYDNLNNPPREETLPRIGTPLREGDILLKPRSSPNYPNIGKIAKSYGQSSSPYNAARGVLDKGSATLKKYDAEEAIKTGWGRLQTMAVSILKISGGWPFQQTPQRRALSVILGSPYSEEGQIINAIRSLTQLAVCSLEEDRFGKVQQNIRDIFQLFTATVENLEAAEQKLLSEIHWTDVEFKEGTQIPEIEILLKELRAALQDLIAAFANYSDAMTLANRDMRKARNAAVDTRPKKVKQSRGGGNAGGTGINHKRPHPSEKEKENEREKERGKEKEKEKEKERGAAANKTKSKLPSEQPEMRQTPPKRTTKRLPNQEKQAPTRAIERETSSAADAFDDLFMSGRNPEASSGQEEEVEVPVRGAKAGEKRRGNQAYFDSASESERDRASLI